MKITNIEEKDDRLIVSTDLVGWPEFVYSIKKFKNLKQLKQEIIKSMIAESKRGAKLKDKKTNKNKIVAEFEDEINNVGVCDINA